MKREIRMKLLKKKTEVVAVLSRARFKERPRFYM